MPEKITLQRPRMWGASIVGYGAYRYTYENGRSEEAPLAAFAIRGRELVVYLSCEEPENRSLLSRLCRHMMGKSCLCFKQLADIDRSVPGRLIVGSTAEVKQLYDQGLVSLIATSWRLLSLKICPICRGAHILNGSGDRPQVPKYLRSHLCVHHFEDLGFGAKGKSFDLRAAADQVVRKCLIL